jgi:DNA polymerase-4
VGNKLVCKMASRAIRPVGLIQIQAGTEAVYLVHQDIGLLPGRGRLGLLRMAAVTRFREIGRGTDAVKQWGSPSPVR